MAEQLGQPQDTALTLSRAVAGVQRYLAKAFGAHMDEVRQAMEELADRYDPKELNRIGFRLYEKFRPDVPSGNEGWGAKAELDIDKILAAH